MLKQLTYSIAACCVSALCMSAAFSQETDGQNQEPSAEAEYTDDDEGGDDKGDGGDDEPAAPLAPPPGGSASLAQVEFETRQSSPGTISALDHGLLGDRVDLATGGLSFEHVDVVLPGNSGLDVSIRRRRTQGETYLANSHEFADWEVVTPRISMYVAGNNSWRSDRCNGPHLPPTFSFFGEIVEPHEYWNGIKFSGPGVGSRTVLDRYGGDQWKSGAAGVSADYWVFECISDIGSANGGGQGFIAVAPNGDRYRLDKLIYRHARPLLKGNLMPRRHAILLATQVTDMEGNQVDYTYDSSGRLTQISGSDGREINVYYSGSGNHIDHVTANGRTWTYSYDGSPSYLTEVELPDGRSWQFDMEDLDWTPTFGDASGCKTPNKTLTVTHPDAIVGTFTIGEVTHGRTYVPDGPLPPPGGMGCEASAEANLSPKYFEVMAIKQKSLSGPGYPQASWVYSYSGDSGAYTGSGGLPDDKWTQVIDPLGRKSISYFNRRWGALEGTLTKEELYATSGAGTPVQTTEYTYIADGPLGLFDMINDNQALQNTAKHPGEITITRGSDWYRTNYTYNTDDTSSTYSYGHPLSVTRTSSVSGAARTETIEYEHDTSSWILGLTASVTRNGKLFDSFDHDALGHVIEARRFGATAFTYTYDGEGMLSSKTNALSEETVYGSYKRGIPRTVTLPDLNTITRTVDDNGWITSETTPRGDTFSYTYNDMGWLTFLGRPGAWSDTTVSYSGLGSGAMAQTSTRGAQRTITTYDSMLRPVEVQLQAISGGGGSIYTKTAYDALSRVTFTSWPSATSGPTAGVNTSYDALDRVTQTQETVSPYAMTSTAYLPGNGISVTDPEGNTTVTWLSAYGAPGNGEPILIEQPEGLSTAMSHDIYGNLLSATQGGFTQTWEYNSRLLVCRHATPETGATLYQYDAADQLIRFAEGQSASSGCPAPPSAERVVNTYDDRGRLVHVNYPNGTPDISIIYDANGNMTQNTRGGAVWDYTYNELDLVETETLTIDGRTYLIGHGYNNDGAVTSQTYPSGITVAFAPDGLGRPTGASAGGTDYADNAAYHPSGALSGFVYGDGHVYTAGFDARQMLASQSTSLSGTALTDFAYTRDSNGRILSITDYAVPGQNRSYTYDDLGRLETASGPWGTGSYSYDGANNLVAKTLGARLVEIDMDGGNRVERVRDSAAGGWQAWSHDARGNVTSNGAVNLTYDRANQPVTLSGAASGSFTYDGHFRRVRQVVDGETIYSVYSLAGQLVHRDFASQGKVNDFISLAGRPLVRRSGTGVLRYVHADHLTSPAGASDAAGALKWREDYTPFGEARQSPGGNTDRTGFTGHVTDDATGLTYMQARYYDPVAGRFLSKDPVGFASGGAGHFNGYVYVGNDPVNAWDPTGMEFCEQGDGSYRECEDPEGDAEEERLILENVKVREQRRSNSPPLNLPILEPLRCPVLNGTASLGFQAGVKVHAGMPGIIEGELGGKLNGGSGALSFDLYNLEKNGWRHQEEVSGAAELTIFEYFHFGKAVEKSFDVPRDDIIQAFLPGWEELPDEWEKNSVAFTGLSIDGALLVGLDAAAGYNHPGAGNPCPK